MYLAAVQMASPVASHTSATGILLIKVVR